VDISQGGTRLLDSAPFGTIMVSVHPKIMNTFDNSQIEDFQGLEEFIDENWEEIMNNWNHKDFPIDDKGIATQR
jgi:hypothetical protein